MPFTIVRQDITKMKVDAIVNAANTALEMGGGVCRAIFRAAGAHELQTACNKLAPIQTGEAVITPGFRLDAKFVIHTAGPVYRDGKHGEEELLRSCYTNSLKRALENGCVSVAFPLISSGIYGYPKVEALHMATAAIQDFLNSQDMEVSLVVFDKAAVELSEKLLGEVASYIDEHYVEAHRDPRRELLDVERKVLDEAEFIKYNAPMPKMEESILEAPTAGIDDLVDNLDEPFSATLLRLIDAKGKTDVEVYKRANLDRKLFSKIRTSKSYMPSKRTAVALAVALELSLDETDNLLERAGYALSRSQKFDVIVEYFIVSRKYDIIEINEVLFKYDQPLLGG
ncbi:macro domain-containing protein [Dehalobacter sp.]|uniref:macro domain-containing protein n=1 Tax=Dehalobacter sp. TaxID=1962289 RepID=UPI00258DEB7E|nr:macro domain-containing protein [Dehalobacter sp.]MCG1024507.1 macro domain-containing protein [Dehalobacter sp.]